MIEVRALEPEEVAGACADLHDWLRPGSPFDLAREYPLVYGPVADARHCGVFEGGLLRSHAALRCVDVMVEGRVVRIGLIGSVATAPQARRRGLAHRALDCVHAWATEQKAAGTLLWSDRLQWYAKLGYGSVGRETHIVLARDPEAPAGLRPRTATPADTARLLALHEGKPVHVRRTREEFAALLRIPGMHTFVAEEGGRVSAYACLEKGQDFPNTVHELGGEDGVVETLLSEILASAPGATMKVIVPPYREELRILLGRNAVMELEGILGLGRGRGGVFEGVWVDGLDSV
jgi:GNAT superfamily N-acetyltransferase